MNNTFYFNPEWMEALKCLTKEIRDKVISAIVIYQTTGQMPELTNGKAAFMFMKLEVDRRNRNLAKAREKRAEKKAHLQPAPENTDVPTAPQDEVPATETSAHDRAPLPKPEIAISPEKKKAIGALIGSLMQPRPTPLPKNT